LDERARPPDGGGAVRAAGAAVAVQASPEVFQALRRKTGALPPVRQEGLQAADHGPVLVAVALLSSRSRILSSVASAGVASAAFMTRRLPWHPAGR
jgi:hypothetical protein